MGGRTCLLMVAKQATPSPVDQQKQLRLVERQAGLPVLYGQAEMALALDEMMKGVKGYLFLCACILILTIPCKYAN